MRRSNVRWRSGRKNGDGDCKRIVDLCIENKLVPVIPKRKKPNGEEREDPDFDKKRYKERNFIERCI